MDEISDELDEKGRTRKGEDVPCRRRPLVVDVEMVRVCFRRVKEREHNLDDSYASVAGLLNRFR
jgi:hypothetical protein